MSPNNGVEETEIKVKCDDCKKEFNYYLAHGICADCRKKMFESKKNNQKSFW